VSLRRESEMLIVKGVGCWKDIVTVVSGMELGALFVGWPLT
jgi:hypothetical protein